MQFFLTISVLFYISLLPNVSIEWPNGNRLLMDALNLISQMLATY